MDGMPAPGSETAEQLFRGLVESAPDAIAAVRENGTIALVNAQVEALFGYSREELIGQPIELLVPEPLHGVHEGHRSGYFADPHTRPMGADLDLNGVRKDGSEFPVEISLSSIETEEGNLAIAAVRDISERRRAEAKFRSLLVAAPDAIVAIDSSGAISLVNAQTEVLFGYAREELVGAPVEKLVPGRFHGVHTGHRNSYFADPHTRPMGPDLDLYGVRKDGSEFPVEISLSSIETEEGIVATAAVRDVSGRKIVQDRLRRLSEELEGRVEQRTAELEAAVKELEAFSYSISHDLRAPLRAIDGFSHAVLEDYGDRLDEEGRGMLQRVRAGSQRMGLLIDEMLNLSRVTRQTLERRRVDLSAIAMEIALELEASDPERSGDFRVEAGVIVDGDPALLRAVLGNLLENAWKFTQNTEQPLIEFGREEVDGQLACVVRDNGAGFDMEYAERLFRPFERLHNAEQYPGVGVGLATVLRIVHRHGGSVWANGKVDEGAAFFFDLEGKEPE
jgi:PAS domain S-box-containing protein